MKIIHLSDLHIGKSDYDHRVERVVEWILRNRNRHESHVVLITGDIVDDGARWQYKIAREHVNRLRENGFNVLCAPGNHDYGPLGITESQRSVAYFQEFLSGEVDYPRLEVIDRVALILLDSMFQEIQNVEFWGAEGMLGETQISALDGMLGDLEKNPEIKHIIASMHHHPFEYKRFHELRDADHFLEVITGTDEGMARVHCLLFGHKHLEQRFNEPPLDKESRYGIDLIYAAGSTVERTQEGHMIVPLIDLQGMKVKRYKVR